MQIQSLFQLINPLAFLLFAGGFLAIYLANRSLIAARVFAMSYAIGAVAFTIDFFRDGLPVVLGSFLTNGLYTATSVLFTAAISIRYAGRIPTAALSIAALGGFGAYAAYYFMEPDIYLRSIFINFVNAGVLAVGVFAMRKAAKRAIDKVVFIVNALLAAQCVIRPLLVGLFLDGPMTIETYTSSLFYLSLHLVLGALAIAMAMSLLVAFSMETIEDLGRRSVTDVLSGVFNRRGFEEEAEAAMRAMAAGDAAALLLADIDRFKAVNDTYGHGFGDRVIAQMGALFRGYSNAGRIAGRLGGEEFALFIPGARLADAANIAEAMRRKFAAVEFEAADRRQSFAASFGVAQLQKDDSLFDLLARADEALYLAKETGRDRVATEEDVNVARLDGALAMLERRQFRRTQAKRASA